MYNSFYTIEELNQIGFKNIGTNIRVSRKASIYEPHKIEIGSNVRIDDFCILSGNISIGSYIHISAYSALYGKFGITLEDYTTLSGRTLIYSATDDYSGEYMTNPMVSDLYTNVTGGRVFVRKHAIVGAGSIILPNVDIKEGAAIGSMSLVNKSVDAWSINAGIPCKKIKHRRKDILELEEKHRNNI